MKKILVTGGAGFIGSEFVRQAVYANQYTVEVVDSISYAGDRARLKSVWGDYKFHKVDIRNAVLIHSLFKKIRPDIVVHFAAETHVDRSILEGQVFLKTNILGTQALLEAARHQGIERFVHISTDEVYGDVIKGSSTEKSPFSPNSPYSVSKAGADMLVSAYARTYKLPVNIIRASNNYGPWQYPEKLVPVVIYKALNHQKVPVYAKGMNVREWLYVADCVRGIMTVVQKAKIGEVYNIGSDIYRHNIDIVRLILKILGRSEDLIQFVEDRPGHDFRYSINCTKIHRDLAWKPEYDLKRGLADTVRWYCANRNWLDKKVSYLSEYWNKVYKVKK
ncbi:MAG: dTDP-glucose 4,6-dehydratase [Candidatus Omnitrophica bacterium]|nr:dTDP-glucose 4,6-dehydratase [Candidatus Omnitrophota bacterium]